MARPRKEIDFDQLVNLARIHCTAEECAAFFGVSSDTIDRRLKEAGEGGCAEFYKKHSAEGKASLRRAQWVTAQGGNPTMLIWLGKQWLGQKDTRWQNDRDDEVPQSLTINIVGREAEGPVRVTRAAEPGLLETESVAIEERG
ncbi:hypothetical protein [Algicella marina]|uniref:Uncharacterized protein n=1 Tax=Algicella marina TaxID=2683284 RepID=A0A6P1SY86_9RHOB|nr:hypothetical protein [Algicella marina]QHQ35438.1 hypothetical protein GO499_09660 [Algicella marina]